tara:strand:- start:502 stop:2211 length:1710 start_codon:yes stop_codon:yes gene_type:complete
MFKNIFLILPKKAKIRFIKTLILSFFSSVLELLSLGLIIPIIYVVINPENELLVQIISFLKIKFNFSTENINDYLIASLIVIFILKTIFLSFFAKYQQVFKRNIRVNLSQHLFRKYLNLQYIKASKKSFAEMQRNIDNETLRFSDLILSYTMFINEFMMAITIIVFLFFFNFNITLILSVIFILMFGLLYLTLRNKFKSWGVKGQEAFKNYNNTILQTFNNLRETKLQGKEDFFTKKFEIDINKKNRYEYNHRLFSTLPRYFIELTAVLLIFLVLFVMLENDYDLDYVLATLGLFAYASVRLLPILNKLTNLIGQIKYFSNSAELILNELSYVEKYHKLNHRKDLKNKNIKSIELKNINFAYKKKYVLKDTSFKLNKGVITGIYGPSGSGKTTLLDILSSLIIPDNGEILINNETVNSKEFFWGKEISYISQSTDLFNDTIEYNISFGEKPENIDKKKMDFSLNASNLKNFIKELPEGLSTKVGEKGSQISTGQKQRINIARAFYNNAKVLIMDESTNSLDLENETSIFNDIAKLKKDLIVIIVSHNKNLLRKFCDQLYELNNFKVTKI